MGLKDFTSTVLTRYKADTSDHKRELKKLRGAERKAHKERLQELEDHNAKLDKQIETWGKVAAGIGVAVAAGAALHEGYQRLQERSRLMAATQGADLDRLKKATNGLVSETRLLEFASKAMNGTFKLSQEQMDQALKGALALRKTLGVDLSHALERVQQAITEGTTEPLKELGLVVKGVENDTREGLMATLDALQQQAREAGPDLSLPGDAMEESGVKMADAMDKLMVALGRLAIKLEPVVQQFARLVGFVAELPDVVDDALFAFDASSNREIVNRQKAYIAHLKQQQAGPTGKWVDYSKEIAQAEKELALQQTQLRRENTSKTRADWESRLKRYGSSLFPEYTGGGNVTGSGGGGGRARSPVTAPSSGNALLGPVAAMLEDATDTVTNYLDGWTRRRLEEQDAFRDIQAEDQRAYIAEEELKSLEKAEILSKKTNMAASIFGSPAEIDLLAEAVGQLSTAFDTLAEAAGVALTAIITNSELSGAAIKKVIADGLLAMAVDMGVRAMREAAMGTAMLFINPAEATTHFKAAGMFFGGAVAAGAGARMLGAGQSAGPASTAGTAGVGRGGTVDHRGGGLGQQTQVYILGDNFGGMSARERESRFRQMGRAAGMTFEGDVIQDG